jgi:hypothetical protein
MLCWTSRCTALFERGVQSVDRSGDQRCALGSTALRMCDGVAPARELLVGVLFTYCTLRKPLSSGRLSAGDELGTNGADTVRN